MSTTEQTGKRGYPLPVETNDISHDVLNLRLALEMVDGDIDRLITAMSGFAANVHGHAIGDIDGLVSALEGKASVDHGHSLGGLSNVLDSVDQATAGSILVRMVSGWAAGNPAAILGPHEHELEQIRGLAAALAAKATPADIVTAINTLVGAAPSQLDTLVELATALGNDANFSATVAAALGLRVRVDAEQVLSAAQRARGRSNLGLTNDATGRSTLGIGTNALGNRTVSAAAPSGGADGDVWMQV